MEAAQMWWTLIGILINLVGGAGAGVDQFIWAKSAPLDVLSHVPAMTRWGFGVPRLLYNIRHCVYWTLIALGALIQVVVALRRG
jgi:hypothetical protein